MPKTTPFRKVAVFGDLHLTDNACSLKLPVLDWALAEAAKAGVDAVIGIGDLTASGTAKQNELLHARLKKSRLPFYSTPGNAELRSSDPAGRAGQFFPVPMEAGIFFVDTSSAKPEEADLSALAALPAGSKALLCSHYPPEQWGDPAREVLEKALARGAVSAVIAGHTHADGPHTLRGLDPDKASGGPPSFLLFQRSEADGEWKRSCIAMPGVDPADWTEAERASFLKILGVSCMWEPLETLAEATKLAIPVLELRHGALDGESPALYEGISAWREAGGRILSFHLPNLRPGEGEKGCELYENVCAALRLGVDRVTLHVPEVTAERFPQEKERLTENFLKLIGPLLEKGVTVGIENLHTRFQKWGDDQRNFGCTIKECSEWISHLRARTGSDIVGFHLDIGHARNNVPFSRDEYVSDYFGVPDLPLKGCHFHQICKLEENRFKNHLLLEDFYGKIIPLSGCFLARRAGLIPPETPIILEINVPGGGCRCYRKFLEKFGRFQG